MRIVFIVHYYPPLNSSGAKRVEALSKYFSAAGNEVTVLTPVKSLADGEFTEKIPPGVSLIELSRLGLRRKSTLSGGRFEPMYVGKPSWKRRVKDWVMNRFGQIPDPRLPFALSFIYPWFDGDATRALRSADIVIATTPPWPSLLAGLISKLRFGKPLVLDYRDHFSECHEMPGGPLAKWLEKVVDRQLVRAADHVVCISEPMTRYYSTLNPRVTTIMNGYDDELFNKVRNKAGLNVETDGLIRIRYMGIVSPGRVPYNIFQALVQLRHISPSLFSRLRVQFFGNAALIQGVIASKFSGIGDIFEYFDPISYLDALKKMIEADYLLFSETSSQKTLSAQGILTTKLFEYIGAGRPVLADISPDTLAGSLLLKCGSQHTVGQSPDLFLAAFLNPSFSSRLLDSHSSVGASLARKVQAKQYESLLAQVVNKK